MDGYMERSKFNRAGSLRKLKKELTKYRIGIAAIWKSDGQGQR